MTLTNNEALNIFISEIQIDLEYPPAFIINEEEWESVKPLFTIINRLLHLQFLSDVQITLLTIKFNKYIDSITIYSDPAYKMAIYLYFNRLFDRYIEISQDLELFEIVKNITEFKNNL